jgi:thioredoxin-related protein
MRKGLRKLLGLFGLIAMPLISANAQQAEDQLDPGMVNPGYVEKPAWFKDSFLDIREDLGEATANNKRLLLYFYQDGCPYCERLVNENLAQKDIAEAMQASFDVIAINMWGDREVIGLDGKETTEKQFAVGHRVMFTPTLLFFDEQGGHVLRLNGYIPPHKMRVALDYVSQAKEKELGYREYMANVNPAPSSGKLHQAETFLKPPYDLSSRSSGKPLLVLFEQKQCQACDELHLDIFQQPQTEELLDRFDVVLLDMWSREPIVLANGESTTAEQWARKLEIAYAPSMVFFDANANEVFRSEAWFRTFHVQSVLDYVSSNAYQDEPELQRFIEHRADALRARGIEVDLMK